MGSSPTTVIGATHTALAPGTSSWAIRPYRVPQRRLREHDKSYRKDFPGSGKVFIQIEKLSELQT
jgi:hypothetical protein